MAITGYTAQSLLNWLGSSQPMPLEGNAFLALFTTAPADNDTGYVEVSGGGYARVQVGGSLAAAASWTTSSTTITMAAAIPSWVVAGMTIYDTTASAAIGTVKSTAGTTLTLNAAAAHASSGATDNLTFSIFDAASGAGPASMVSGAAASYPLSTASWGTVDSWGIFDELSTGNLRWWDYLGNDPWFPFTGNTTTPYILAPGITAGSTPTLTNGSIVEFTARFGGSLPGGIVAGTQYTVSSLISDGFSTGAAPSSVGNGMVRQITLQSIPSNVTATFNAGQLTINCG